MLYTPSNSHNNTMVNTIRKRQVVRSQKSWWVRGPYEDKYYSSYLQNKHYIYSFQNNEAAKKCYQFLNEYKFRYNTYPDLSQEPHNTGIVNTDEISDIYIDTDILTSIKYKCSVNNIGLMCIEHFDYQFINSSLGKGRFFNLDISGIDIIDDEEINLERQIKHYEELLNF